MSESPVTSMKVGTRQYRREQYACLLRLRDDRVDARVLQYGDMLHDHIQDTMTRWLRRCVLDQAIVTGMAHIEATRDFMFDCPVLRAWAYAYQDVAPPDTETLASMVDTPRGQTVYVRHFVDGGVF